LPRSACTPRRSRSAGRTPGRGRAAERWLSSKLPCVATFEQATPGESIPPVRVAAVRWTWYLRAVRSTTPTCTHSSRRCVSVWLDLGTGYHPVSGGAHVEDLQKDRHRRVRRARLGMRRINQQF
jgi:hypothetical protein